MDYSNRPHTEHEWVDTREDRIFSAWRLRPSRQQRSLAAAFVGEIAAILQSMKELQISEGSDDQAKATGKLCRFDIPALPKFTIYEANAQRIVTFDRRTARELAYFYTCLATLFERLRALSSQLDLDERDRCIRLVNSDAERVLEAGDQLLRRLRPLVSRQRADSITRA